MGRQPVEFTLDFLIKANWDTTISRYLAGCAATLVIYDWILVFDEESRTIWQSKWTVPKILYYFIRTVTPPFICFSAYELSDLRPPLSQTFCAVWPSLVTVPMLISIASSNWLFTLRLLALYKRRRYLVWFMRGFFVATYATSLGMLISSLLDFGKTVAYYPEIKACGALEVASTSPATFYTPAAYETFIFALTSYQAYKDASVFSRSNKSSFLVVLYRDGLIAFLVMLAVRSWNIWIYATQPVTSLDIGVNLMWAVNTILSTRVYLNLVWHAKESALASAYHDGYRMNNVSASINMRVPTTIVSFSVGSMSEPDRDSIHSLSPSIKESDSYGVKIFVNRQVMQTTEI